MKPLSVLQRQTLDVEFKEAGDTGDKYLLTKRDADFGTLVTCRLASKTASNHLRLDSEDFQLFTKGRALQWIDRPQKDN